MSLLLLIKRLFVVVLLVGLTVVTLFIFFPIVENRLPIALAIVATYCFVAYIGLPLLIRIWQFTYPPNHVPTRSIAGDGWALDPINLVVLAKNEKEFIRAMHRAGWVQPEPLNLRSSLKTIAAVLLKRPYARAPFSNTYVFGKKQDLGFQIQIANDLKHRHHVRFWRLGQTILEEHEHVGFWQRLLAKFIQKKKDIWVGAVSMESGVNLTRLTLQITHRQQGDTDASRDFLVSTLMNAGVINDALNIKAGEPLHTRYQAFGEVIIADGFVTLCELKRQFLPPPTTGRSRPNASKR